MTKNFLLLLCLFQISILFASAQVKLKVNFKVKADTINIPEYDIKHIDKSNQLVFKMKFGEPEIKNPKEAKRLTGGVIQQIELVYTNYPVGADLELLNKRRLIELYLLAPEVFDNPMTEWKFVAQTKCKSNWDASRLFHGIVITYRKAPTAESAKEEATFLKDAVKTDYSLKGMVKNKTVLVDSTVLKIFNRNSTWKNMLVVGDFTGSMSPYIAQVLIWHSLNIQKKPVRVILCGAQTAVNIQYLDLALQTKGSIHTIEEDIEDLVKITEGKTIKIGKKSFRMSKGKFVPID